jgi:uncharacterized membrane protein
MMRSNGGVVVAIVLVFPIIVVVVSLYCFGGRNRESQNASQSSQTSRTQRKLNVHYGAKCFKYYR